MSDRMLFVLHGLADEKYAADLAAQLGGLSMAQGAGAVRFGANVVCVQVWSGAATASNLPDNTVICRLGGAPLPFGRHVYDAQGDAAADAVALRPMIATLQNQLDESATRSRGTAPRLGATQQVLADRRKPPLAVRSAAGMVVTLGVAGVIAPMIMERAQATSTTSTPPATQAQTSAPLAVTPPPVAQVAAESPTPAVDRWLTEEHHAAAPHRAAPLGPSTAELTPLVISAAADQPLMAQSEAVLLPISEVVAPTLDPRLVGDAGGELLLTEQLSAKSDVGAVSRRTVLP